MKIKPPAAKKGDLVTALDMHLIVPPSGTASLVPHPFRGSLGQGLSRDVRIEGSLAATVDSGARNQRPHAPQGGSFSIVPTNSASVVGGSTTVRINRRAAARVGDSATSCNDARQVGHASISALLPSKVRIGD